MKFYTKKFDMALPVLNQINIPDNSDYIIGLEFAKNGTKIEAALADVKLVLGETEISPMETKINGYIPFRMSAGAGRDAKTYDVVLDSEENKGRFKLAVVVEDADVGDLDLGGGGSGGYAAGDGIEIEDGTISVNDEIARKDDIPTYTAGDGIEIEDGTISVTDEIAKKDDIPTDISELNNDAGYITTNDIPTINMDVELEDGSTVTYVIYGQEQQ